MVPLQQSTHRSHTRQRGHAIRVGITTGVRGSYVETSSESPYICAHVTILDVVILTSL